LNGFWVRIPSLRERPEDIEILANHFVEKYQHQYGKRALLSLELLAIYRSYSWPGNVRELRQELHRMVLLTADGQAMRPELSQVVRLAAQEGAQTVAQTTGLASAVNEHERRLIIDALQRSSGNKAQAARTLNMSRTTLIGKIRRLGLE
jgi:transcriptional regulator with PAS, ATPase and Fis domain